MTDNVTVTIGGNELLGTQAHQVLEIGSLAEVLICSRTDSLTDNSCGTVTMNGGAQCDA